MGKRSERKARAAELEKEKASKEFDNSKVPFLVDFIYRFCKHCEKNKMMLYYDGVSMQSFKSFCGAKARKEIYIEKDVFNDELIKVDGKHEVSHKCEYMTSMLLEDELQR